MDPRNPNHQRLIRYSSLLQIKKELVRISNELNDSKSDAESQLENIGPDHLWTQYSEVSRDDINSKLRIKLEKILTSENTPQKHTEQFYDSIHAILLVLALYWPRNDFVTSGKLKDCPRPKCPISLMPINIEDINNIFIFSDGRLFSKSVISSIAKGIHPLTNKEFCKRDIYYNLELKSEIEFQTKVRKLKKKWMANIMAGIFFTSFAAIPLLPAPLIISSLRYSPCLTFVVFYLSSIGFWIGLDKISYLGAQFTAKLFRPSLPEKSDHSVRAKLLLEAIQTEFHALAKSSQSTVNIDRRLKNSGTFETKMDAKAIPESLGSLDRRDSSKVYFASRLEYKEVAGLDVESSKGVSVSPSGRG